MAWWTIKHICGHSSERQLYGKETERKREADYFASQVCPKCWKAEQDKLPPLVWVRPVADIETAVRNGLMVEYTVSRYEIIVTNSFGVKDYLKAREYKFGSHLKPYRGQDMVKWMMQSVPGWSTMFSDLEAAQAEIAEFQELGWRIQIDPSASTPMSAALMSAAEGKPEYL